MTRLISCSRPMTGSILSFLAPFIEVAAELGQVTAFSFLRQLHCRRRRCRSRVRSGAGYKIRVDVHVFEIWTAMPVPSARIPNNRCSVPT